MIGWIGTGVMGASMARQLLNAGYDLQVHNRTKEKALGPMQSGAVWKDSPAEAAEGGAGHPTAGERPEAVEPRRTTRRG